MHRKVSFLESFVTKKFDFDVVPAANAYLAHRCIYRYDERLPNKQDK